MIQSPRGAAVGCDVLDDMDMADVFVQVLYGDEQWDSDVDVDVDEMIVSDQMVLIDDVCIV